MKLDYPVAVRTLILQLKRLPGIGPRSAERMALWLLQQDNVVLEDLAANLRYVTEGVSSCQICGFFTTSEGCAICNDSHRDRTALCVVEEPADILPIERTGAFAGFYHALGGRLSPLDNVGPEDLRITELERRLATGEFTEIVLALGADVAGEATSNFLADILASSGARITKLAQGMPVGGGLDTADALTLHRAFENRGAIN
ncbi:MAG: recombination protein RecR [Verrucomicrobiales bacterium]|jgi:recombination protein RecR